MVDLVEIKKKRFLYLSKMYEESNASTIAVFKMDEVGVELGFDNIAIRNIVNYLIDEGLIEPYALGGTIQLTHWGIKEVEQAYEHPTESTEHFAPIVNYSININSSGYGSVINTGNENTINISNTTNSNEVVNKTNDIITTIQKDESLTVQVRNEVVDVFNDLIREVQLGKPSTSTIDKIFTYGGSISSIGSLVVGLIQLLSK